MGGGEVYDLCLQGLGGGLHAGFGGHGFGGHGFGGDGGGGVDSDGGV